MTQYTTDVVIVGGGLVGASLALALAQGNRALGITLIEAGPSPLDGMAEGFETRVVALNASSRQLLDTLGVWAKLPRVCAYRRMEVWDGEGTGAINFDAAEQHWDDLGYIVENRLVVAAVWRGLEQGANDQNSRLVLLPDTRVDQLRLTGTDSPLGQVTLANGDIWQAPLIIAADGAQSPLRSKAGITTRQWSYGQTAIVTRVTTTKPHHNCAFQRFATRGPLAFLPLAGAGFDSSIVWSLDDAEAQAMMVLDDVEFCSAVSAALEYRLGAVTASDRRLAIPLHQSHATKYCRPGFALVGDAAHSIHPLAGQGVNLGLADAQVLGREILRALKRGIPLEHPSILARYQRQRISHNLAAMAAMEGFKRLFGQRDLGVTLVRNIGLNQVNRWSWLKQQFMQLARGA